MLPRRAVCSLGAPSARCTMYWSVHQYHNPMTGAQMAMPSQGNWPLKYHASLTMRAAGVLDQHRRPGAFARPRGRSGFHKLNMSEPHNRSQFAPAAQFDQAIKGQQRRAADEHDDLHGVVIGHRPHAAQHRVKAGQRPPPEPSRSKSCQNHGPKSAAASPAARFGKPRRRRKFRPRSWRR